jgi:hypothetical protein
MKKTIIAALASLMLAGAISAVGGATASTANGTVVIVGDGATPFPSAPLSESSSNKVNNQN